MNNFVNIFKTGILFTILTAILLGLGYYLGGPEALLPFLIFSIVLNIVSYWFSSKIALSMSRARPLSESEAPAIYRDVRELSARMNIPMPKLYVSEEMQPNAFATGRNPKNGVVCVTRGLLNLLNPSEVKGVLAHELAHIQNRDILTATIAAVMAGIISYVGQMAMFMGGGDSEDRNPVAGILMMILAPIGAVLIQLAISRSREYAADYDAAIATKEPLGLASALEKIHGYAKQIPMNVNPALSSLYIQNPFKGSGVIQLFSTHPPMEKRVAKLKEIKV